MEREEQEFLGIVLFTYEDYQGIDAETMQYWDMEFPFESMKKYNGDTQICILKARWKL